MVYRVYSGNRISLTYDHRAVDGAPASLFLGEIKKEIENISIYK
jgi:pyruvate dehydrogenase E2 component (dihydrolipoamide acetyltransferase)